MTLYYSLVFFILVAEMALFMLLIVPLPFTIRRKMFTFISESPIVAKLQYGMKICFIFILILFIDSVNRVYRVQVEVAEVKDQGAHHRAAIMGHERSEVQARKFYSQRNMYLCGFTLFLSLILNRTYIMILDLLRLEEKVKKYEGDPKVVGKGGAVSTPADAAEISRLKKELAQKDRDLETLKKQAEGLSREYNNLGDQVSAKDGTPKKDR
ncbi:receptor-associated protein [Xylogone sp. PMI_703]|nr:receptor-associated protein [Xylogone sp. PMI_703]